MAGTIGKQLLRYSKIVELNEQVVLARLSLVVGLVLNIVGGPILEIVAFGQAPQTLLAPISGLDVLWNILLVPYTLGEVPSSRQQMGCLSIVMGTALTAIAGPHRELPYALETMQERLLTMSALTYILAEVALMVLGTLYLCRRPHGDGKRGFALGVVAGGIGGNLVCMKVTSSLLQKSLSHGARDFSRIWTSPLPLLIAALAAVIALVSAGLLAHAMREFDATMMVATYEGSFVLSGCASGVAVLGELDVVGPPQRALYTLGVFLVVCGVLAAQPHHVLTSDVENGAATNGSATNGSTAPLLKS